MKFPSLNPNYRAALLLIIMAGILVVTAILTNRNDFTSAALVIAGLVCLLTGIFFATLSGSDPLDLGYLSLLPVQGCINLARTCADLGISGNACFIPKGRDGRTRTVQYIPVALYRGEPLSTDSFVTGSDTAGLQVDPSCTPLLNLLRERDHLVIPPDLPALHGLVHELGVEVLEVAPRIHSMNEGDMISVTLGDYRLIGGCRAANRESPRSCVVNPCPICSLFASVYAEGTGNVIQIEQCNPDPKKPDVNAVFSIHHE